MDGTGSITGKVTAKITAKIKVLCAWIEELAQGSPWAMAIEAPGLRCEHYSGGADAASAWDIGSLRKSFNSALAGQLAAEGLLRFDQPACELWPELLTLSGRDEDRRITLHHLLSGTSGWLTDDEPGRRFRYNNSAFTAAERVVAAAMGDHVAAQDVGPRNVAPQVARRLIEPLGLCHTRTSHRDAPFNPQAFSDPGPKLIVESTVGDLLRWGRLWLDRGFADGRSLVPPEHVTRATTAANPDVPDGKRYGYGWFVNTDRALWPSAPSDAFGHPGNGFYLADRRSSRCFLLVCPSLRLTAAICNDPRTGIGADYGRVPMAQTDAWIGRVLALG